MKTAFLALGIVASSALVLSATSPAWAQAGVQITPDGKRSLISKDVGGQRWAITLDDADGTVTGNVFSPDGGAPQFVWCETLGEEAGDIRFRCAGADRCPLGPCGVAEWAGLGEVTLPRSFFAPAAADPASPLGRSLGGTGGSPSGSQDTPDRHRVLISKDVGGERWAISRNAADGTVTGNVFRPGGGEPLFVWCDEKSSAGADVTYACHGADRCDALPCDPEHEWSFVADVTLPAAFFATPDAVDLDAVADALVDRLGDDDGAAAFLLALDRGYSLRQIVRAALAGRVLRTGELSSRAGGLEAPEGPPLGLFGTASPSRATVSGGELSPASVVAALKKNAQDADLRTTAVILLLARHGYDANQITEIALGSSKAELGGLCARFEKREHPGLCKPDTIHIRDDEGRLVLPSSPTVGEFLTRDTPDPPPPPAVCGDDRIEQREECDGAQLAGETCESRGFPGGTLRCTSRCLFDASGCSVCGNGVIEDGEDCEPTNLEGVECTDLGFLGGTLRCKLGCKAFDTSRCDACGNDRIDDDHEEVCDGTDLGDLTCETFGLFGDGLRCGPDCFPDASGCSDEPIDCTEGLLFIGCPVPTPTPTPEPTPTPCPGDVCPDGSCVPAGADCCGGGKYCSPGTVCAEDKCCPAGLPILCGGEHCAAPGSTCCPTGGSCGPGLVCAGDACCPSGFPQVCGDLCITASALCCGGRNACVPGSKCCRDGCIPVDAVCCPLGGACAAGWVCTDIAGVCCPVDAPKPCVADQTCRPVNVPCP